MTNIISILYVNGKTFICKTSWSSNPIYDTKKDNSKITWHQQCYKGDNSTTLISEMSDWESFFDDEGNFNKYTICLLMIS